MVLRNIIVIDEDKCTGCEICTKGCPEGALQMVDGKARLVSEIVCDGLGACIDECPEGAITLEEREAEAYDEKKTMVNIVSKGENMIKAHLKHLKHHRQKEYLKQAIEYLNENNIPVPEFKEEGEGCGCNSGCSSAEPNNSGALEQWPVQLKLVHPEAPFFKRKDVVIMADCVAYAMGDYKEKIIGPRGFAIACPKLDSDLEGYVEKIKQMIVFGEVSTITVAIMSVPCCRGLANVALAAKEASGKNIPVKKIVVDTKGSILSEDWI